MQLNKQCIFAHALQKAFEQDLNPAVAGVLLKLGKIIGLVVQLVRIPACHAGGRGFESRPDRQQTRAFERSKAFFVQETAHFLLTFQILTIV